MKEFDSTELIDIHDVTRLFDLSIEAVRKYKAIGLIEPCERVGRKDLYDMQVMLRKRDLIREYKQDGKCLKEIAQRIKELKEQQNFEEIVDGVNGVRRILIIEDNDLLVDLLREQLRTRFHETEIVICDAKDGLRGVERARRIRPDLIILDLLIPKIEGKEVHRILTRESSTHHSKFLIYSGELVYRPKNAVFLQKPFDMDELLDEVENLLGLKGNKNRDSD